MTETSPLGTSGKPDAGLSPEEEFNLRCTQGRFVAGDADDKFDDGWLRTGDVGTISEDGYLRLTDRSKDIIKSGGEWISSVELENQVMGHPAVREAVRSSLSPTRSGTSAPWSPSSSARALR